MHQVESNLKKRADIDVINSAFYDAQIIYFQAVQSNKIINYYHDFELVMSLKYADMLGREVVKKNFEKSTSPKQLFNHLDYYKLNERLIKVIYTFKRYSRRLYGFKLEDLARLSLTSPYSSAVIKAIHDEVPSLNEVKVFRRNHLTVMGVKDVTLQRIEGTEKLFKVLNKINHLLRQSSNRTTNNFNQDIERVYDKNLKFLNGILNEYQKLHFVRVFLTTSMPFNERKVAMEMEKRLDKCLSDFLNRYSKKKTIFAECVGHIKGKNFAWGVMIGCEFIFFFKYNQHDFNFYKKQHEILNYWYSHLNLGLESPKLEEILQPHYARHFNVNRVLDIRDITGLLDFMIRNVLPVILAHKYFKSDWECRVSDDEILENKQNNGASNALQQTAQQ